MHYESKDIQRDRCRVQSLTILFNKFNLRLSMKQNCAENYNILNLENIKVER